LFDLIIKLKNSGCERGIFERELVGHFAEMLKLDLARIRFRVEFVDEIPLDPSGKLMAVVSNVRQIGNT
jgi:acyl-coenzyme A synthetase/AMP-(fatty) acid ligase